MSLNSWESKSNRFLTPKTGTFDGDFVDIADYINSSDSQSVMEIGIGNSRLLRFLLPLTNITYFGFDKTMTFIKRAKKKFKSDRLSFNYLNMEDSLQLSIELSSVSPDLLILHHVIEHLPNWGEALSVINRSDIRSILIAIHNEFTPHCSHSDIVGGLGTYYTLNSINEAELHKQMSNYVLTISKTYKGVTHSLKIFEIIK